MKFPRTKIPSANILANTSFEPSKSYNFFENDFKTRVKFFTSVKARRLSKRNSLRKRKQFSRSVSLTLVVSTLTVILSQTSCFLTISHSPTPAVRSMFPSVDTGIPWYDQLQTTPTGKIQFQAWARSHLNESLRFKSQLQQIANIVLITKLTTCAFGDKRLFFKHEFMEPDFAAQPSWKDYVPRLKSNNAWGSTPILNFPTDPVEQKAWLRGQLNDYGCPFAWLLNKKVNPIY